VLMNTAVNAAAAIRVFVIGSHLWVFLRLGGETHVEGPVLLVRVIIKRAAPMASPILRQCFERAPYPIWGIN
jgi:hypothetical protein